MVLDGGGALRRKGCAHRVRDGGRGGGEGARARNDDEERRRGRTRTGAKPSRAGLVHRMRGGRPRSPRWTSGPSLGRCSCVCIHRSCPSRAHELQRRHDARGGGGARRGRARGRRLGSVFDGFDPVSDRRNFVTIQDPERLRQQTEEAHALPGTGARAGLGAGAAGDGQSGGVRSGGVGAGGVGAGGAGAGGVGAGGVGSGGVGSDAVADAERLVEDVVVAVGGAHDGEALS